MTVKERIIKRLNKGFGFGIPLDAKWKTHDARGYYRSAGAFSWYFVDTRLPLNHLIGSADAATECLKWKRWLIDVSEQEIFQYIEGVTTYDEEEDLLEEIN